MNTDHPPLERFERILAREPNDTEHQHIASCDRCQAMLRMLREFESPTPLHEARLEEVEPRLTAMIADIVGADAAPTRGRVVGDASAFARGPATPLRRRSWPRGLLAIAACLAVAAAVFALRRPAEPPLLRGDAVSSAIHLLAEQRSPAGLRLAWTSVPNATGYRIVVLDARVEQVAAFGPTHGTSVLVGAAELNALALRAAKGESFVWQVEALSGRDVIGYSGYRALALPRP